MKRHRFIGSFDLTKSQMRITEEDLIHQMKDVLKLRVGEEVIFVDKQGQEGIALIQEMKKDFISAQLLEKKEQNQASEKRVTLYCAMLKRENFEWVIQKATELGVYKIVPLHTERTVKTGMRKDRLEKIAKEASEQSERVTIPEIGEMTSLKDALETTDIKVFLDKTGEGFVPFASSVSLYIGPEGGWTDQERNLAKQKGAQCISLSSQTLRAETAAIIATYLSAR